MAASAAGARDRALLTEAVALAVASVTDRGGPFGALVADGGAVIGRGTNRVVADLDPSAHAEVVAIRAACRRLGSPALAGCTLYSSCEPCPMCLAAALWARLDRVVFAADRHDAAAAGFDDRAFHELIARPPATWPFPRVEHLPVAGSAAPFAAWELEPGRLAY